MDFFITTKYEKEQRSPKLILFKFIFMVLILILPISILISQEEEYGFIDSNMCQECKDFVQKILFNLGLSKSAPKFKRFSYVEKAEYWALIWGNAVMIITGILLWFDNTFIQIFPKGVLDVALVVHYYEAILASLAILIWHMYATVFNPEIYPMNPAWLTGKIPKDMFQHEHSAVPEEEMESEGHDPK
jgi:cytochrome b subunit of formate dehydrogenase